MKAQKFKLLFVIVFGILGIVAGFYYIIASVLSNINLKRQSAYTISYNITIGTTGKTGTENDYTFFLNGKWYAGYTHLHLRRDGTKYFIKFYPKNPNYNEATKIIADSTDIKNLPRDGYKELPHK